MTAAHYFIIEKCVDVHKSPTKKCDERANIYMKNVNDVDFDANINRDMCMKVMSLFMNIKLRIAYTYIHTYIHTYIYISCVLLSASFMYMMM